MDRNTTCDRSVPPGTEGKQWLRSPAKRGITNFHDYVSDTTLIPGMGINLLIRFWAPFIFSVDYNNHLGRPCILGASCSGAKASPWTGPTTAAPVSTLRRPSKIAPLPIIHDPYLSHLNFSVTARISYSEDIIPQPTKRSANNAINSTLASIIPGLSRTHCEIPGLRKGFI